MKANKKYIASQNALSFEEIEQALKSQPHYIEFFKNYDENSVKSFIQCYAAIKFLALQNKNVYKEAYESFHSECMSWADSVIKMILQKKLFNLQCLWRAEEITLSPFIEVSKDFEYWSKNILACPFIEPITKKEFEIALSFLQFEKFDMPNWYDRWQDYPRFKEQHYSITALGVLPESNTLQQMPAFYAYYDFKSETGDLLDLPDIRGEKEAKYDKAFHQKYKAKGNQPEEEPCINPKKPILTMTDPDLNHFIKVVEDGDTKEAFFYKNSIPANYENHELERNLEFLKKIKEPIAIQASSDWKESIAETVRAYKQRKTLEYLPYIYDLYCVQFAEEDIQNYMFKRMKDFKYNTDKPDYHFFVHWRNRILEGRKILGEPENFNF